MKKSTVEIQDPTRRKVIFLIGAAAGLSACGGDGSSPTDASSTSTSSTSSSSTVDQQLDLRRAAPADRGPVLRGRGAEPLGHPRRHLGRDHAPGRPPAPHLPGVTLLGRDLLGALRSPGRRVALRRPRRLLGRREPGRAQVPPRLPGHRRVGARELHDHLPGLVHGPRRAHPLQDPDVARVRPAATSSRPSSSSTRRSRTWCTRSRPTTRRAVATP